MSLFFIVLIFGIILVLVNTSVGVGATLRIPSTDWNFSIGGSLGKKQDVSRALPGYLSSRVAGNNTFFNQSNTVTIWEAEGMGLIVLGSQPEAPLADLHFNLIR